MRPWPLARRRRAYAADMPDTPDPTKSWVPGEWYLVTRAKACNKRFMYAHDPLGKIASKDRYAREDIDSVQA